MGQTEAQDVAYGCQTGPNGKSLIDRLIDAWVTDSKNQKNRAFATTLSKDVNTQRASATTNNAIEYIVPFTGAYGGSQQAAT